MNEQQEAEKSSSTADDVNHHSGIVLYTDGGCQPNPGNGGWGVHGYHYTTAPSNRGPGLASQLITARGYIPASQKGKCTYPIVQPIQYFDFFGSSGQLVSNNAAEVDALFNALDKLKDYEVRVFQIFTDSEYLRRGLTEWVPVWITRGWRKDDGSPISNAMQWQRLVETVNAIKNRGIEFSVDWVKGHNDDFGNTIADKLASIAVTYTMNGIMRAECNISQAQGYWKTEVQRHPFINFRRLYFNSTPDFNVMGHYYQAETGADDFIIGKRMPETCYSVVRLKEPDPVIEKIKSHQFEVSNMINAVMMMRLDKVYNPDVYPYVESHGKFSLRQRGRGALGIDFVDRKPITVELNPAGLSLRAIESFGLLEDLLERYIRHRDGTQNDMDKRSSFRVHDITDVFYEKEEKVKKKETITECRLKPMFGVGFKDLMVEVDVEYLDRISHIKVPLVLGADLPPRNSLKRVEAMQPKVFLLTWKESEESVRYATVIDVPSGVGIWSNFFADRIYLQ